MLVGQGRPTARWGVATASAVCGVVLLAGPAGGVDPVGIALALLSALGYAGYTVTVKSADRPRRAGRCRDRLGVRHRRRCCCARRCS